MKRRRRFVGTNVALSWVLAVQQVFANPVGEAIVGGSATLDRSHPGKLVIHQGTDRLIINWRDFSIARGETTKFIQPSETSIAVNRVVAGNPSKIYGSLEANGIVYVINPNGILVGPSGAINTRSFIGSTLDAPDDSFMAGARLTLSGNSSASVVNQGSIEALGGDVFLVARHVENSGTIRASGGMVGLAAGSEVMIVPSGEQRISVIAGSGSGGVGVNNAGTVEAVAAELKAAGGNIYALAINNGGVVRATGVRNENGRVFLTSDGGNIDHSGTITARNADGSGGSITLSAGHAANNEATVISTGTIAARGDAPGAKGGEVKVLGDRVALLGEAVVDVSGDAGGGVALIGGDFQGRNADVQNAKRTAVGPDAQIKADAGSQGDGGKVIVWADEVTKFAGGISARGGASGGNGGLAEVSGKQDLVFVGTVDLSAPLGSLGTLLLDPDNITITDTADGTGTLDDELTPNGDASVVFGDANDGANTVSRGQLEAFGDAANIILSANDNITINDLAGDVLNLAAITGSITFTADADNNGTGAFSMNAGDAIRTQGGNVTVTGVGITVGSINTTPSTGVDGGDVTITSHGGGDVTVNGSITTQGGVVDPDNVGRAGGDVDITAAGLLAVNAINTSGGAGADDGPGPINRDGGAAGDITLISGTGITLNGNIIAEGGAPAGAGTAGADGDLTLTATAGGASQAGGALTLGNLILGGAGTFTLNFDEDNDVANLTANVNGAITYRDANALTIVDGVVSTDNSINISTVNGTLTVANTIAGPDVDAGTGTLSLTAGSTRTGVANENDNLLTVQGGLRGTAGITLAADNMTLSPDASGINAGTATATLRGAEDGTEVGIRDVDVANRLGLSATELGTIASGSFVFGHASGGNIRVLDNVDFVADDFTLLTGADILFSPNVTLTTTGDATLIAGANITGSGSGVHVEADVVTLQTTGTGDIGSSGTFFSINGNSLVASTAAAAGNDIFVREEDGLAGLSLNAGAGASEASLTLDAGDVTDTDGAVDITAATATVILSDNTAQAFGASGNRIQTSVGALSVSTAAGNGDQFIIEDNGLTGLTLNAGTGTADLNVTAGDVADTDGTDDIIAGTAVVTLSGAFGATGNRIGTSVGSLTVDSSAGNGSQFITEANGLTALELNAGSGTVDLTLTAGALADGDLATDITAASATITAASTIGTLISRLQTSVDSLSVNTASGNGNQFLSELSGLTALNLNAGSGNIDLSLAAGAISDIDTDADLTAGNALVTLGGAFGDSINRIGTSVNGLSVNTSSGNAAQFITEASGLTALELNAGSGTVDLTVTSGSVTDADGVTADITASTANVTLSAGTAQDFGASGNRISTSVDSLNINTSAGGGSQFITEADGLGQLNLNAGAGDVDLTLLLGGLQDLDGANDITADDATVLLSDVLVQNVGSAVNPLNTSVDTLAVSTAAGGGNQFITEASGLDGLNLVLGSGNADLRLTAGSLLDNDGDSDITANGSTFVLVNGASSIGSSANPLGIGGTAGSATLEAAGGGVHVHANATGGGNDILFTASTAAGAVITTTFDQGGKSYSATYANAVGGDLTVRGNAAIPNAPGVTVLAPGTLTLDAAGQIGGGVVSPLLIDAGTLNAFSGGNAISIRDVAGGLALGFVDAGAAEVNLSALGGSLTSASVDGTADLIGGVVNLSVSGAGSEDIGAGGANPLEINATTLTADNDGGVGEDISILDTAGGLSVASVDAGSGNVNLGAVNGSLTSATVDNLADVVGNVVTLSVTGAGSDIGVNAGTWLEINANTLNASTAGALGDDIFVIDRGGGLLAGLIDAGNGAVDLTVLSGSLTSAAVDGTPDILGGSVTLAVTDAGLIGTDSANPLEVDADTLSASTAGGPANDIFLLDTAGGVAVGIINALTGDVNLRVEDGGLTSATVDGTADILGATVNLAVTGGGNDIGSSAGSRLEIDATTLNATTDGAVGDNIFIEDTLGGLLVGNVNAAAGDVDLRVVGGNLNSATANDVADIRGRNVTLAVTGAGNDIGGNPTRLEVDAEILNASTSGGADDDILIFNTDGNVEVGTINAGLGDVNLRIFNGGLTSELVDGTADVVGDTVTVSTVGAGRQLGNGAANPLEVNARVLNAETDDADISLLDTAGGVIVNLVDAGAGDVTLGANNGDITGAAFNGVADVFGATVTLDTTGSGSVGTSATEPLEIDADTLNTDVADDVFVENLGGPLTLNDLTAGGDIRVRNFNTVTLSGDIDAGGGVLVRSLGTLTLGGSVKAGNDNDIVLSSEGALAQVNNNSGVSLTVNGTGRWFIYSGAPQLNVPRLATAGNLILFGNLVVERREFEKRFSTHPPSSFANDGLNVMVFEAQDRGDDFDEIAKFFGDFIPVEDHRAVNISFGQYDPTRFGEVGDIWLSSSEFYEEERKAGRAPRLAPDRIERMKFLIRGK